MGVRERKKKCEAEKKSVEAEGGVSPEGV